MIITDEFFDALLLDGTIFPSADGLFHYAKELRSRLSRAESTKQTGAVGMDCADDVLLEISIANALDDLFGGHSMNRVAEVKSIIEALNLTTTQSAPSVASRSIDLRSIPANIATDTIDRAGGQSAPSVGSVPTVEDLERERYRLIQVIDTWATYFDIPLMYAKNKRTCFEELLDGILTSRTEGK